MVVFYKHLKNHINGHGCKECGLENMRMKQSFSLHGFIKKANKVFDHKYDYSKVKYVNSKKEIIVICKEHGEFNITPVHHYKGHGCKKCSNNYRKSNFEYIEACKLVHNNFYDYSLILYKSNKAKVKIICPLHGEFLQSAQHHKNGCGCPSCDKSKGELAVETILANNKIEFKPQKTFEDCLSCKGNKLRYDFYLLEENICIEFDGQQHYKPSDFFGGTSSYEELVKNDEIKNNYCIKNNIGLIRIKYDQNIGEILKQKLKIKL